MDKKELRTRVEAELLSTDEPNFDALSSKYNVPANTIRSWLKKLQEEKDVNKALELTNHTTASLEVIRDKAKEVAPQAAQKIDDIIDGVQGLDMLKPEFHSAMEKAVKKAHDFLDDDREPLSIKEWQIITTTLAQAYAAIFNKSGTTVNVAQNNINTDQENMKFFKQSQKPL